MDWWPPMAEPTRVVRLSRAKGSKREPGVVVVDRSTPYGNPFRVEVRREPGTHTEWVVVDDTHLEWGTGHGWSQQEATEHAVVRFEEWARLDLSDEAVWIREHVHELAGGVIGCWCDGPPCHAYPLARMADVEGVARDLAAASACSIDEARRLVSSTLEAFADG